jgi:hypothetical protein
MIYLATIHFLVVLQHRPDIFLQVVISTTHTLEHRFQLLILFIYVIYLSHKHYDLHKLRINKCYAYVQVCGNHESYKFVETSGTITIIHKS